MRQALIATIIFCIFYALQIVFQQLYVRTAIHPLHLNFLSYALISIVLSFYFLLFNKKAFILIPDKKVMPVFILALGGWMVADFFAVYGLRFSSSINYSILSRLMIFVVFTLSILFLHEKANLNKISATIISALGGMLVIYNFKAKIAINPGDLFFLITVITLSISSVARQKITNKISSFQLTYLMFIYSAVILGFFTFFLLPIQGISAYKFIFFNSFVSLIGFSLVNYAIQKGGAVFFTLVANLLPVFTIIFSSMFLRQLPVVTQILGGILIIFSIFLFQKKVKNVLDR